MLSTLAVLGHFLIRDSLVKEETKGDERWQVIKEHLGKLLYEKTRQLFSPM